MTLTDIRWIDLKHTREARGVLTAFERPALPFDVKRIFYMHGVPEGSERGAHAHRDTRQCVIAVAGAVTIDVADGAGHATYVLDDPNRALYMPAMTWVRLYAFSADAVVLVLCDTIYNPAQVIRSWDAFLAALPAAAELRRGKGVSADDPRG